MRSGKIQSFLDTLVEQGFPKVQIPHEIDSKFDAELSELISNLTNPDPHFHRLRCGATPDDNYYSEDNGPYTLSSSSKQ